MMAVIQPNWPVPTWVRAVSTTSQGGVSQSPYDSLNLALHVGDNPHHVQLNRLRLRQRFNWQYEPLWLLQTHSDCVLKGKEGVDADGMWTTQPGLPCVVLTGDCVPLLFTDTTGSVVGAVHCGWRGILKGIIENAIHALQSKARGEILAWLGPAIGPCHYEVGEDVRRPFIEHHPITDLAFKPLGKQKYLANLAQLVTLRLNQCGVNAVFGGQHCTYAESSQFFSHRRDKITGRMATLIWLEQS